MILEVYQYICLVYSPGLTPPPKKPSNSKYIWHNYKIINIIHSIKNNTIEKIIYVFFLLKMDKREIKCASIFIYTRNTNHVNYIAFLKCLPNSDKCFLMLDKPTEYMEETNKLLSIISPRFAIWHYLICNAEDDYRFSFISQKLKRFLCIIVLKYNVSGPQYFSIRKIPQNQ